MNRVANVDCGRAMEKLDFYLDRELAAGDRDELDRHLAVCESCALEIRNRTEMRRRLRSAVQGTPAPDALRDRISASIHQNPAAPAPRRRWQGWAAGIAAAVMVTIGSAVVYELGHLRFTAASQESYIASISQRVAGIMRVGLGDHVHCTVFRKYPRQAPPAEKIAADLGPTYLPLVKLVRERIPSGFQVTMAHRCKYHGRQFVHLAMVDGVHRASLVIAGRQPGETFQNSGIVPAISDGGLPVYRASVQRFTIEGFQTAAHLVYFVSDLPADVNERMMASISAPVRDFLATLDL